MTQILDLADNNFKIAIINLSKDVKEKMISRSAQIGNANREMENALKNQILERKSTEHEMNASLDGLLTARGRWQKKG